MSLGSKKPSSTWNPWSKPHPSVRNTHWRPTEPTNDTLRPHNAGTRIMILWMAQCVAPFQPEKFTYFLRISIFSENHFLTHQASTLRGAFSVARGGAVLTALRRAIFPTRRQQNKENSRDKGRQANVNRKWFVVVVLAVVKLKLSRK